MKLRSILLILLCSLSVSVFAKKSTQSDTILLQNLIQDTFDHIFSERAPENIPDYLTEDFILLEHGEIWNNDTLNVHLNHARNRGVIPHRENRFEYSTFNIEGKQA